MTPDLTAYDRLRKDGAYSTEAVRRRIALIAAERMLDPRQTRRLMTCRRLTVGDLGKFGKRHRLSFGWRPSTAQGRADHASFGEHAKAALYNSFYNPSDYGRHR